MLLSISSLCCEVINMISVSDISRQDSFSPSAFCSLKCFMWVHTIDDVSPGGKKKEKKKKLKITFTKFINILQETPFPTWGFQARQEKEASWLS